MARGKYQLLAPHYFQGDIYLFSDEVVGDDTPYPFDGPPSFNMRPLDPVAQAAWDEENAKDKPKPEGPAKSIGPLGSNPSQGPRTQTGSVSGPGGVHGSRGLAEAPRSQVGVEAAKAMAVQAAMIPKEELDKAIEQERARLADEEATKAIVADANAAAAKAKEEEAATPKPVVPVAKTEGAGPNKW